MYMVIKLPSIRWAHLKTEQITVAREVYAVRIICVENVMGLGPKVLSGLLGPHSESGSGL